MGFTAGIYRTKKYGDLTPKQYNIIDSRIHFETDEWAKGNYGDWDNYRKSCVPYDEEFVVTDDMLEFFRNNSLHSRAYSDTKNTIFEELETWCSNAREFDDWLRDKLGSDDGYNCNKFITKEIAKECIEYCDKALEKFKLSNVIVEHAYKEHEDGTITLIPCDGVEVIDENGRQKRIPTDSFEWSELFAAFNLCPDEWTENAYTSLKECMMKILATTDFENEVVTYEGGW